MKAIQHAISECESLTAPHKSMVPNHEQKSLTNTNVIPPKSPSLACWLLHPMINHMKISRTITISICCQRNLMCLSFSLYFSLTRKVQPDVYITTYAHTSYSRTNRTLFLKRRGHLEITACRLPLRLQHGKLTQIYLKTCRFGLFISNIALQ